MRLIYKGGNCHYLYHFDRDTSRKKGAKEKEDFDFEINIEFTQLVLGFQQNFVQACVHEKKWESFEKILQLVTLLKLLVFHIFLPYFKNNTKNLTKKI